MPIVLADTNLPELPYAGFFDEHENALKIYVQNNGSGYYKLTYKNDTGGYYSNFIEVTKVEDAEDSASMNEDGDRLIQFGDPYNYQYVKFVV